MRVLLIDVNCKHSSTGKIVYDLYKGINDAGHTAAICYGRGPIVDEINIYKFSSNIETYIHAFLTRITGLTGIYSPKATKNLIKFIEEFKPDIVHIHEIHGYFVNIATLMDYIKKNNIKTVWTFHSEFMYTGKCGHSNDCEKWKNECGKCPQLKEYPKSYFLDFTRKMLNDKKQLFLEFTNLTIVTPSKWLVNRVSKSFLKHKDIHVIYNGIDTETLFYHRPFNHLKEKHGLTDEKIILAVAPNLMSDSKGGKWVLKLSNSFQDTNVKFILIGVDDLTQKFNDNMIALGRISNQIELSEYYSMADLLVLTSEKETFSLVSAESLACGTPIVGFESGAPSEIAPEGYGKFVPYGDIESLSKLIFSFFNGELILKSKKECELYSRKIFSKNLMIKNYLQLYMK